MSFLIDFDSTNAQTRLTALEKSLDSMAGKATQVSVTLGTMAKAADASGNSYKKLKDEAEKAGTGAKRSIDNLKSAIADLSGANGKDVQKMSVEYQNLLSTYKSMVAGVKGGSAELIAAAKAGGKQYKDQTATLQALSEKAKLAREELNKMGTASADLARWQKQLAKERAVKKLSDDAIAARNDLNSLGTASAQLVKWQQELANQRSIKKISDDAIAARNELNRVGTASAQLVKWQQELANQRSIKKIADDAIAARNELNKVGTASAELVKWQQDIAKQRALKKVADDAILARLELNRVGTEAARLSKWQKEIAKEAALKKVADDAKLARLELNRVGTEAARLSKWQKQLAADRAYEKMRKEAEAMLRAFDRAKAVEQLKLMHSEANYLNREFDKAAKKSKSAASGISEVGRSANVAAQEAAALRAALNAMGTHMGIFTSKTILTAAAVYATVSAFKSMLTIGSGFTGEMVKASAIMGATGSQAKALENEVRRLGETTAFTGQEAAGGLTALAMSGLSVEQSLAALAPALNLAAIGQIDMYRSADILTNVMYGFRLGAEETTNIVDILATSITSSNATIEQMANALSYVAPIASAARGEIKEVVSILEVFHNAGIKGSRAGTSLRRAYSNLLSPSEKAANVLHRLGVSTVDVNGNMLQMTDIMRDLAVKGANTADVFTLFGVRAAPAMQVLLGDLKSLSPEVDRLREGLDDSSGAAETLRQAFEESLGSDTKKLFAALEEKAIQVFKDIEPLVRAAVKDLTEFVRAFDPAKLASASESLVNIATSLADVSAGLATLLGGLAVFKVLKGVMPILVSVSAGLSGTAKAASVATFSLRGLLLAARGLAMVTGIGAVITVAITAAQALYEYANANEIAAEKAERLAKAERDKAAATQAALPQQIAPEKAVENFANKDLVILEKERLRTLKDVTELNTRLSSAKRQYEVIAEAGVEAFQLDVAKKALADLEAQTLKATAANDAATASVNYLLETGYTPEGIQRVNQFASSISAIANLSFSDRLAKEVTGLNSALKDVKFDESVGFTGKDDAFTSRITAIERTEAAIRSLTNNAMVEFGNEFGRANGNLAKQEDIIKDAIDAYQELQKQLVVTADARRAAKEELLGSADFSKLMESSAGYLSQLKEEQALLIAGKDGKVDVTAWRLENAAAIITETLAKADSLNLSEDEIIALKAQAAALREKAAAIIGLVKLNKDQDDANKVAEGFRDDFKAGKGLGTDDAAQAEWQEGVDRLNSYVEHVEGKLATDRWYVDAKKELDQELIENQNATWFELGETISNHVSTNISEALTMQATWKETGDNIKKSIIGSIVGALVAQATQMATNALLSAVFSQKEIVQEGAMATAKVTAEGVKTAAVVASSATESAASTTALGGIVSAVVPAGAAVAAAWGPAAAFVSLATLGANSIPASIGIASTFAMAAAASLALGAVTAASGLGGREIGGHVNAGQSYVVGERGAEVFTPTTAGAITSNADVKRAASGGGGGGTVNNYYEQNSTTNNIKALDSQDVRRALANEKEFLYGLNTQQNRRRGKVV